MRALTLSQPWASLVAQGAKRIETRSWPTPYRGRLAIHAAKKFPLEFRELVWHKSFATALRRNPPPLVRGGLPFIPLNGIEFALGAIVAMATLEHVGRIYLLTEEVRIEGVEWTVQPDELAFGDYTPGRYGWVLRDIRRLKEPVPCRGALGLWTVPAEIERSLR